MRNVAKQRPAEATSIVAALIAIVGIFTDTSRVTPEATAAIIFVGGLIPTAVTWITARLQRKESSSLASAPDGKVVRG